MSIQNPKWSNEPNKYLVEYIEDLKKGTVLDLGGSDGVNAIFLAQSGFDVTNVDKDAEALRLLASYSKDISLEINTVNANLNEYNIDNEYDNVISFYTFHFLDKDSGQKLIENIQSKTRLEGLNILIGFTDQGEFKLNNQKCYFVDNFLLDIYKSWEILYHSKFTGSTKSGLSQEREVLVAKKVVS